MCGVSKNMDTNKWNSDDTQIWSGTIVRVFGVNNCKEDFYDYIVSFIYDNTDYLQLTCLTQGEGGNILCVLKQNQILIIR